MTQTTAVVATGTRPRGRRLPRVLRRPWLLAGGLLAALVAAEAALRVVDARRGYSPYARTAWYWLFEQDPFLGYRGRPHGFASIAPPGRPRNADRIQHGPEGFRDQRSFAELGAGQGRPLVVCLGEGNTYGLTAGANDRTYPAVLERELRRLSGDHAWTVFNAGLPGYTSHEMLELLKLRLLKLRPDVVLAMGLKSDHEQVTIFLDEALDYDYYPLRMAPLSANGFTDLLMRSALVGRLAERWRGRYFDDLGGRPPMHAYGEATERGHKLFFDNVALMAELCRRSGTALMWVDQPMHYSACNYGPSQTASVERMRAELKTMAGVSGFALLEAHEGFDWEGVDVRGDLLLASNEAVLGTLGYERLAARLAPQVLAAHARSKAR